MAARSKCGRLFRGSIDAASSNSRGGIYAADPCWVPPLLLERKQFLDPRKHPFYRHGAARQFLAWRGNEPIGRILASDDPLYNAKHGDNVGCFGMFESIDDPDVAHALLDAGVRVAAGSRPDSHHGPDQLLD